MQIVIDLTDPKLNRASAAFAEFRNYEDPALPADKADMLRKWLIAHIVDVVRTYDVRQAERQARAQPPIDIS